MVTSVDVYKKIRCLQLEFVTGQRAAAELLGIFFPILFSSRLRWEKSSKRNTRDRYTVKESVVNIRESPW